MQLHDGATVAYGDTAWKSGRTLPVEKVKNVRYLVLFINKHLVKPSALQIFTVTLHHGEPKNLNMATAWNSIY